MHPKAHFDRSTRRGQEEFAGTGSRGSRCACATPTTCSGRALVWWTRRSGSALGAAASSTVEQRHLERSRTPPRHRRRLVDPPHLGQRWHGEREQQHASVPLRRVHAGEVCRRCFSTNSRPALRAAACGGRPRAGSATTATREPASPSNRVEPELSRARRLGHAGGMLQGTAAVDPGHLRTPRRVGSPARTPSTWTRPCLWHARVRGLDPSESNRLARNARKSGTGEASQLRRVHYSPLTSKRVGSLRPDRGEGGGQLGPLNDIVGPTHNEREQCAGDPRGPFT
jgi:hypothetical protein